MVTTQLMQRSAEEEIASVVMDLQVLVAVMTLEMVSGSVDKYPFVGKKEEQYLISLGIWINDF